MTIQDLKDKNLIIFEGIVGSKAYGTNMEHSDTDIKGVFIQPLDDILGTKYVEQVNDEKNDIVYYELRRFLQLLSTNNPTMLELLALPDDCILYKNPIFDLVLKNKDMFLTKNCRNSFGQYALHQIKKAKGQNKKQNWEKDKVTRKTPLDFCYLHIWEKSKPLVEYLLEGKLDQKFCGLSKTPHGRDVYALFYDYDSQIDGSERSKIFKGIEFENSNDIKLSSIPSDMENSFIGHISYNKDGYTQHCIDYKSYQTWLEERNVQRWVDVKSHDQKIDGKNMMHCKRLIQMAHEIADGKGIIVRRPNAKELISIRKGEIDLQTLIDSVEVEGLELDELFKNSSLPESVDTNFINTLLIEMRKKLYNI